MPDLLLCDRRGGLHPTATLFPCGHHACPACLATDGAKSCPFCGADGPGKLVTAAPAPPVPSGDA